MMKALVMVKAKVLVAKTLKQKAVKMSISGLAPQNQVETLNKYMRKMWWKLHLIFKLEGCLKSEMNLNTQCSMASTKTHSIGRCMTKISSETNITCLNWNSTYRMLFWKGRVIALKAYQKWFQDTKYSSTNNCYTRMHTNRAKATQSVMQLLMSKMLPS